ncbi:NAD(P)/FAD-dependent oxidoreductase [Amycolatopsis sp. TNS106]|uniref:NAD(P)/FAD-dependent oxidoreductase n=1 Tax=Amycolatopsis sp. TNS106 TaxID=2861750 RepID=UPI001C58BA29|nr:NAD(P)/FAD-dependent oxidoreductase [Amycolatopsis sp. TNS106]
MYDVIVVGGGIAGLSAAQVLGRAHRNTLVIAGGEPRNASAEAVHGVVSRDGTPPGDFAREARAELEKYSSVTVRRDSAVTVDGGRGDFVIQLGSGEIVGGRRLILATGVTDDLRAIEGLSERWGRSVLHCPYCHGWEVSGGALAVVALSVLDAYMAAHLTQWSKDVLFCVNGVELYESQYVTLNSAGVRVHPGKVVRLGGDGPGLGTIEFEDGQVVTRDALFVQAPTRQRSNLPADLGCDLHDDGTVAVDELGKTSIDGVHAVGDMARRQTQEPGLTFVATAMGDGVLAAIAVNRELFFTSLEFG